jgi:hypothetical protein
LLLLRRRLRFAPLPLDRLGPLRREPCVAVDRVLRLKPPRLLAECELRECAVLLLPLPVGTRLDRLEIPRPRNENREKRTIVRESAGLRKKYPKMPSLRNEKKPMDQSPCL